jgi:hypothetical protein
MEESQNDKPNAKLMDNSSILFLCIIPFNYCPNFYALAYDVLSTSEVSSTGNYNRLKILM